MRFTFGFDISALATQNALRGNLPFPPAGFVYVARNRDGVMQYAASPSRNAYAIHRSA